MNFQNYGIITTWPWYYVENNMPSFVYLKIINLRFQSRFCIRDAIQSIPFLWFPQHNLLLYTLSGMSMFGDNFCVYWEGEEEAKIFYNFFICVLQSGKTIFEYIYNSPIAIHQFNVIGLSWPIMGQPWPNKGVSCNWGGQWLSR